MGQVHVPEDVSVKKVKEFYLGLREAMKGGDELVLDFSAVNRVDLAVMQVLLAMSRECRKEKIILKIKAASEELKNQMRICGMIK
jgi:anti-anti-sigma regulatory factor